LASQTIALHGRNQSLTASTVEAFSSFPPDFKSCTEKSPQEGQQKSKYDSREE
jgi:hypothetical protein